MKTDFSPRRETAFGGQKSLMRAGVTVVKIMVIVFFLVLLTALFLVDEAPVNLESSLSDGRITAAQIFVTQSMDAPLTRYKLDTGSYPTTAQGLKALIVAPPGVAGWKGPYLDPVVMPLDPWKNPYHYAYPPTHSHQPTDKYDLWSSGPSGINGAADNIGNWQEKSP